MGMVIAVLSGFLAALATPWVHRLGRKATGWIVALLPLGLFVYFASLIKSISAGEVLTVSYAWFPSLGVNLSFYLDGLSLLFALLISGFGALVMLYAGEYLAGHPQLGRFYACLLMFMASMFGLVLAGNLVLLFVFWELTSLSSYLLIGFHHEREEARSAALQALLVTGIGGLALLAGILLIRLAAGTTELSVLLGQSGMLQSHALYVAILLLVLTGAFTKSAQFPFHFWLPGAMEAPSPVSAYLHSATMVKAGIYLLARLYPVLGGTDIWYYLVTITGAVTMLAGAVLALTQKDMKRILAFSTVSALGILTLLLGLGSAEAMKAAMVFLLAHALYKGAFFLIAGAVDHETGTRDITRLGGLRQAMPITAIAAGLAALSMAGLPPMLGFISKELLYEAKLQAPRVATLITSLGVLANTLLVAVAGTLAIRPFFGVWKEPPKKPHEAPFSMWLSSTLPAILGLFIGLWPDKVAATLLSPAISAVRAQPIEIKLGLWHGWNPVLVLSLLTLAGGCGIFYLRGPLGRVARHFDLIARWGPARCYQLGLDGLNALARLQTRWFQSGYLRIYLLMIISTTVALAGYTLVSRARLNGLASWREVRFYEFGLAVLTLLAAWAAVRSKSRLGAVAALGVVGYSVALLYILFGAPDLAMTQFLIETLTVILFVLVFYHLPRFASLSTRPTRIRDLVVALMAGGLMTSLVLVATSGPSHSSISDYFAQRSLTEAHGRNTVNVILVDFRALDTLGEITVLAVAAIGVYALLKLRANNERGS